ncbi:hypothetical protein BJ138DRAFT_1145980 [Hygrophoropsis aurantiaca]|uniref:Uncharacterized protein n=1 Tax=Hygrophoropsis aurantiaca TaxID=72124 RepID=A0ACB8ALV7_9AGAM|nr:hypothetical protein BJ138DRAFT_1145980 [Hygrophoropsis aurantiaca]
MSDRPSSVSSEKTIYFDVPSSMHFFSHSGHHESANDNVNTDEMKMNQGSDASPVANQHPANGRINDVQPEVDEEPNGNADGSATQRLSRSYLPPQQGTNPPGKSSMSSDGKPLSGRASGESSNMEKRQRSMEVRRTPSLHSLPESTHHGRTESALTARGRDGFDGSMLSKKASVRSRGSVRTSGTASAPATAFMHGAALTGPNAEPDIDHSILDRGATAERSLSKKQKDRIVKDEEKDSKRISKLLKTEASAEKTVLGSALTVLASLQTLHKAAIKREVKAETSHAKALAAAQKAESKYHEEKARAAEERARAEARCAEERARWEGKEGEVRAQHERVDAERETVREMEERVAECAREVERLRIVKGTDERERQAKLAQLALPPK